MRMTVQAAAAAALSAAAALLAVAAPAFAGERAALAMPFTATTPGTQTGLTMDLRYMNPDDPNAKPPTISKLAFFLPEGTRLDPTALPVCEASDQEIQARGRDACPAESLVGTGTLDVWLGAPGDPQRTDLALFNGPSQIIEILLFEGTNTTAAFERLFIEGAVIRANPAQVPPNAPPEDRAAASHIVWDIPAHGGYLVTPRACDGKWTVRGEFEFADGSRASTASDQACTRGGSPPRDPSPPRDTPGRGDATPPRGDASPRALRVFVSPTTIRRGRPSRVRVRLVSSDARCLRGTVRVGRRVARTDARGRATLVALVRYLPRPQLRVATPCGTTQLRLRTRLRR
ncbi:MAG TPA: hypothetical protein VF529_03075 [Solirubrobacteraceae bacterium]|jgi:hypothetical protein